MHMANELLSLPIAGGGLVVAGGALGLICRKAKQVITSGKLALMGILGAFVFAAQMVNFRLPAMPGTSGHIVGAVLLAIILGPHAAAIVMASVVIVQCLIFQDGGLLALGCNIINMALIPTYAGYYLYRIVAAKPFSNFRTYVGVMLACLIGIEIGAVLVPVQAALSGVLVIPFSTFLITMISVHFLVGTVEGIVTVTVLVYIQQVRPDIVAGNLQGKVRLSRRTALATFAVFTIIIGAGLSLLASGMPDGLEWSYAERPDQPNFEPIISNSDSRIAAVDKLQSKYSLMPEYSVRNNDEDEKHQASAGWTSFAGVFGSITTMAVIWLTAWILRRRNSGAIVTR
ncbi:MAG: cobalamin biosynthesis protein CbiM [Planctomycetes bacterium HGW-Planctomycetes-1]|nr:MAG: cobalamin biosynthesis protein CbiM [Planctomycetes bacterium HGW-Planctomycetes-1]